MAGTNINIQPSVNNSSVVLAEQQKLSEMSYEIKPFNHPKYGEIRVAVFENGEILFCLSDLARGLGYVSPANAVSAHCKGVTVLMTPSAKGLQPTKFGKEGNIYRLTLKSQLPDAEEFQDWVCDDLLPTLRKTGSYSLIQQPVQPQQTPTDYSLEEKFKAIELSCKTLRKSAASKTRMVNSIIVPMGLPAFDYVETEGVFLSAKDCLDKYPVTYKGKKLSAVTFNQIMIKQGYLEEIPHPKGRTSLKLLTEKGLKWGKNDSSTDHPNSITAHYDVKRFPELLKELGLK